MKNKNLLTSPIMVYTVKPGMARPPKPAHLKRSKLFPLKLTQSEWASLKAGSKALGVSVAELFREGAKLYIQRKGKDGSRKRKEERR